MTSFRLLGVFALALGACAPAQVAPTPASAPTAPVPPAATAPAPVGQEEVAAPSAAPENWWQLDASADRFPGTSAERAYRELLAGKQPRRTVVVAIIDSGIDISHPDLRDNVWTNPREVAGNGKDDDGNGYVDDLHGWDFIGGRDGRDVDEDTYEVTRLYARCEGIKPDTLPTAVRGQCPQIKRDFERERAEAQQQYQQIQQIEQVVTQVVSLLRGELGGDSLTAQRVAAIRSTRPEVQRAQQIYAQIAAQGFTLEDVREQRESVESRVKYGLNPEFDPRSIVGDNYNDARERVYGNNEVTGPDATHGTHVAGIVGAERNNGIGMNGMAPAVRIMSVRAVPDGDERDKDVANAIRYAVDNGANVINMSFGKAYSPRKDVVDDAVRYADSKGVLLVHAAGNDAANTDTEPSYPTRTYQQGGAAVNWIEVGASSWEGGDQLAASFSNYSRTGVDVFAPGVSIYSTVPGNGYRELQGTSMASPVVAGLAALIMAYYPDLTATQVKQIILDSATRYTTQPVLLPGSETQRVPFGNLSVTGGIVNAYAALQLAAERSR